MHRVVRLASVSWLVTLASLGAARETYASSCATPADCQGGTPICHLFVCAPCATDHGAGLPFDCTDPAQPVCQTQSGTIGGSCTQCGPGKTALCNADRPTCLADGTCGCTVSTDCSGGRTCDPGTHACVPSVVDGGASDGGASDGGGSSDGGVNDGSAVDGSASDGSVSDGSASDGAAGDGSAGDGSIDGAASGDGSTSRDGSAANGEAGSGDGGLLDGAYVEGRMRVRDDGRGGGRSGQRAHRDGGAPRLARRASPKGGAMKRLAIPCCAFVATLAFNAAADNAPGFAVDRFDPSERGSEWLAADSLDLRGHVRPAMGIVASWAYRPLVTYNADGSERAALLDHQLVIHPGASLVLWDRLRVGLDIPIAAAQSGTGGNINGVAYAPPDSASIGDVRLEGDVRLFGLYGDPLTVAAGVSVYLPSGSRASFTGDGTVRAQPHVMGAGQIGRYFVYAAKLGVDVRTYDASFAGTQLGTALAFAAAAGVKGVDGRLLVGPKVYGSTIVGSDEGAFARRNSPFEALLGAHYMFARCGAAHEPRARADEAGRFECHRGWSAEQSARRVPRRGCREVGSASLLLRSTSPPVERK